MFPSIDYLEWIEGRPRTALYDLGSSDLRGDRGFEPTVVPDLLEDLPDPPAGVSLHTLLATEYGVEPEQVVVTAGATHANFLAAATALQDAEDPRVLVERPGYEPLRRTPEALGATVDRFLRVDDYAFDFDRVENAMTPTTELVTVTNRHNPSGRLVDRDELAGLASRVAANDARLLVDEVYAPFVTAENTVDGPFGGPSAVGLDDTVVTGSLTKFHGLGDVRVGWLIADRAFAAEARRVRHHVPAIARTSVKMAVRAVYHADEMADRSRDLVAENASLLTDFVASRDDLDGFVAPDSTFAFLDPEHADGDQLVEVAWENGLLVVPGRFFDDPERVRVSLGHGPEDMRVALEQLGGVLDRLR